jgi:hypothetical protein
MDKTAEIPGMPMRHKATGREILAQEWFVFVEI